MFEELKEKWERNGLEILFGLSMFILLIISLFRRGKKGSYSRYRFTPFYKEKEKRKSPPKESKGEEECRRVLRELFPGKSFDKIRPDFLCNQVTGGTQNLEIDCYDSDLKLGIEYQGIQHYKYIPYFHKNKEAFLNQKYRDELKKRYCQDHNVRLIEVPYTIKNEQIRSYLIDKLKKLDYIK